MRKLPLSGGEHIKGFIAELQTVADEVAASNRPEFGAAADRLSASIRDLEDATSFMLSAQADGRVGDALAGATPYLRLAGLTLAAPCLPRGRLPRQVNQHSGCQNVRCLPAVSVKPQWGKPPV